VCSRVQTAGRCGLTMALGLRVVRGPDFFTPIQGITMLNKNQTQGTLKEIAGKIQEKAGEIVGSTEQMAKGLQKQVVGRAEKGLGDAKEAVRHATAAVKDTLHKL